MQPGLKTEAQASIWAASCTPAPLENSEVGDGHNTMDCAHAKEKIR